MPYRLDLRNPPRDAAERLIELGAYDLELTDRGIAALMPDSVDASHASALLGVSDAIVSDAVSRDDGSVWILRPHTFRVGRLTIIPADTEPATPDADTLKMVDGPAFGTGLHPTTALCLELLVEAVELLRPVSVLDVGTGTGVLALAALTIGVPQAVAIDVAAHAIQAAAANARVNGLIGRLRLVHGRPEALGGSWRLVVANVLAAPLIEMAPVLVRRVAARGRLILSGIPDGVADDVITTYRRLGMHPVRSATRAGWAAVVLDAAW